MPRHPDSDPRSGWRFYLRAGLERSLPALFVFRVQREKPPVGRAHDDGVVTERARGRPCRGIGVARGCVAHYVFQRDL